MPEPDNVTRLENAGILKQENFSPEDKKVLESLTTEEVDVLLKLRSRMGAAPSGKEHMRPNIIV